jgi:hypothetical protein
VTSSNCRKAGIASAASPVGHSGRPAVDGLLPAGLCWLLGWISGLPAGSLYIHCQLAGRGSVLRTDWLDDRSMSWGP